MQERRDLAFIKPGKHLQVATAQIEKRPDSPVQAEADGARRPSAWQKMFEWIHRILNPLFIRQNVARCTGRRPRQTGPTCRKKAATPASPARRSSVVLARALLKSGG